MRCYHEHSDGDLRVNFVMYVVFLQQLRGPLARSMQLRASFFDAFADVGSQQAKAFLAAKLARASSDAAATQLQQNVDVTAAMPALFSRRVVEGLRGELQEYVRREIATALPTSLRALHLAPEAVQVNINASRRSNAELLAINLPVPSDGEARKRLAKDTLLVSQYLRQKFAETSLSEQSQRLSVAGLCAVYSHMLKVKKQQTTVGDAPVVGQIGRAQMHYTHADRPLMEQLWSELREFREGVVQRVLFENMKACAHDASRSRSRSPRGAM
jgi:hypothetical protein